jgi:hypothetical protein
MRYHAFDNQPFIKQETLRGRIVGAVAAILRQRSWRSPPEAVQACSEALDAVVAGMGAQAQRELLDWKSSQQGYTRIVRECLRVSAGNRAGSVRVTHGAVMRVLLNSSGMAAASGAVSAGFGAPPPDNMGVEFSDPAKMSQVDSRSRAQSVSPGALPGETDRSGAETLDRQPGQNVDLVPANASLPDLPSGERSYEKRVRYRPEPRVHAFDNQPYQKHEFVYDI